MHNIQVGIKTGPGDPGTQVTFCVTRPAQGASLSIILLSSFSF